MRPLTAWMRAVGVLYLALGVTWFPGIAERMLDSRIPGFDAPADGVAARGYTDWMFGFGIDLFVIGVFLIAASRRPERATVLVWLVIALSATRGIGLDLYHISMGYPVVSMVAFIVVHATIIASGVWALRAQNRAPVPAGETA